MTTDLSDVSDGWYIWRHGSDWSTDSGPIAVHEYLDDRGFYCVSVLDMLFGPDGDDEFEYHAVVRDVIADGLGEVAYLVNPLYGNPI